MTPQFSLLTATEHLETLLPSYLRDLEALVNIDSGTFDKAGVDQVAALLRHHYSELGAEIGIHPHETQGDAFVATLRGSGEGRVLLLGHMDTVYPLGTAATRPFRLVGRKALGPGTADMKAGDLSIVYALRALRAQSFDRFAEVIVVHNGDEEIGSPSSREIIRRCAEKVDAVLVLEAARESGDIVSARKGIAGCQVRVFGRSAHAGVNHHRGRSALLELAHLVTALESLNGTVRGATLNVGRVEAGQRPNVVPDYGFAHFEVRAPDSESLREMLKQVEVAAARRVVPDTRVDLSITVEHQPMYKTMDSQRLVILAKRLADTLGFNIRDVATGGASDGNTAASAGRPVLDGLGPIGGAAHSPDEYIAVDSVVPRTSLLAGIIASVGRREW